MGRSPTLPLLCALALAGCGGGDSAAGSAATTDTAADRAAIERVEADMLAGLQARDPARVTRHYAEDAVIVSGTAKQVGRAAIDRELRNNLKVAGYAPSFGRERLGVSGDLGYVSGRFKSGGLDPASGRQLRVEGNYLTVYRRQADGSWKVAEDMNVTDKAELL